MFRLVVVLVLLGAGSGCATPGSIKPADLRNFTSDACSMFPEGIGDNKQLWCHCCFEHDKVYWRGGNSKERKQADKELKACVKKAKNRNVARLMMAGVRVGGTPYFPTKFRWGYGWPYLRGYKEVSAEEDAMTSLKMEEYEQSGPPPVCFEGE